MLYPVYVHIGDETHAHGIAIPDFPGCFTDADSWEELPRVVQEAAELYFDGEEREIPAPTPLEKLVQEPTYHGGVWMLMEIDTSKLRRTSMATPPTARRPLESSEPSEASGKLPQKVQEASEALQSIESGGEGVPKIEIMLPDDLLKIVDEYAASHNMTRSAVLARAALNLMTKTGN